jgi:ABC-2 type transport system ATP-binding protein
MIEARSLSKRYGDMLAVDNLSFTVEPGKITGFLGPNGAGKTTTMRMILGLDRPSYGTVTVNGRPFSELAAPMREVGALLDAKAVHGRPLGVQPPALPGPGQQAAEAAGRRRARAGRPR